MPGEAIYVRDQSPADGPVQVVQESYLDDGTDQPIHAVQLGVPPTTQRKIRFDVLQESIVTAGTLTAKDDGSVGLDPSENVLIQILPVGTYDLQVTAPSGADVLLGAKPLTTAEGGVPVEHAALVQGWLFNAVMNLVAKRVAKQGLAGICPFTRSLYEQHGNHCPHTFNSVPFCIIGYGITCAPAAY
ncbi:MAG: hypothetical protein CVU56_24870 [Deltaproteobacteria bacterium HGW-Deltaproteobacteria-14]|jgi:hypothetical protein|nr:MAG: hypothetical protein CVU56_24870 [Deltaproteobacteria bacterium HGW-Deltaproteobacteria-14]